MTTAELLKPSEVQKRLSISSEKMHSLIAEGKLKAIKLGPKSTRVYADSVAALLSANDA